MPRSLYSGIPGPAEAAGAGHVSSLVWSQNLVLQRNPHAIPRKNGCRHSTVSILSEQVAGIEERETESNAECLAFLKTHWAAEGGAIPIPVPAPLLGMGDGVLQT